MAASPLAAPPPAMAEALSEAPTAVQVAGEVTVTQARSYRFPAITAVTFAQLCTDLEFRSHAAAVAGQAGTVLGVGVVRKSLTALSLSLLSVNCCD
jgi:hypothetical protein